MTSPQHKLPSSILQLINDKVIQPGYFSAQPRNLYEALLVLPRFGRDYRVYPKWRDEAGLLKERTLYLVERVQHVRWHMLRARIKMSKIKVGTECNRFKVNRIDALRAPWIVYLPQKDINQKVF